MSRRKKKKETEPLPPPHVNYRALMIKPSVSYAPMIRIGAYLCEHRIY